ncbi:MAG: exo-alpha-sialidase [Planctomycetota bacterium]
MSTLAIVGTVKGGFLLRSDDRRHWDVEGPLFKGWKVTAAERTAAGDYLVATASDVYGPSLHRSRDLSQWQQVEGSPAYAEGSDRKLNQVWRLFTAGDTFYAGVDEAGLFRSVDGGETWQPVTALNDHRTREAWFPGAGGLCAHGLLVDPQNPQRIWCGISAVGVFRSDDGGDTWHAKNDGVQVIIEDEKHKDIGFCVHGLVADPDDANRIWRQDHTGMYRTYDGGEQWERIESGLSSRFGFPIAIDPKTLALFAVPLESDEYRSPVDGSLAVYRSTDHGDSWQRTQEGLPQQHFYAGVLRAALATDAQDPCGVYFGTTSGTVHVSANAGESWDTLPVTLPRVLSVSVFDE